MRIFNAAIATTMLMAATQGSAQQAGDVVGSYVVLDVTDTGTRVMMDSASMRVSGHKVTAWVKLDHSKDATTTARSSLARIRFDCDERTFATLQDDVYAPDGTQRSERVYKSYEIVERATVPGTGGDMMLTAACMVLKPAD